MKLHWLLPSLLGLWLWSMPVKAASLQSWRFDARNNRLEFTTNGRVQPNAQLVFNPTRLVIDLPGVTLGNQVRSQQVLTAGIREVRIGQFDQNTTRIVVELSSGYTLDPSQVQFVGSSPSEWTVQLPQPQREGRENVAVSPSPIPERNNPGIPPLPPLSRSPSLPNPPGREIQGVRVTADGFFVSTAGEPPEIEKVERSRDQREIYIDLKGVTLAANLTQKELAINSRGVNQLVLTPLEGSDPRTRITLKVTANSPDWQALVSRLGVVLIPRAGSGISASEGSAWPTGRQIQVQSPNVSDPGMPPLIQSVELLGNSQLVIRSTGRINAIGQWLNPSVYTLRLSPARLGSPIPPIPVEGNSPLVQFNLQQADAETVVITLTPRSGITIGNTNQPGSQVISLPLGQNTAILPPIPTPDPRSSTLPIPVPQPQPGPSAPQPRTSWPLPPRRQTPNSRMVVVVDPGHGGRDPGAVGIGGLREKDIVLEISQQVAAILQQNGVQVVLTRDYDVEIDLEPRVALAEQVRATLFVSIHANAISMSRPDVNGLETYYYDSGFGLARTIHQSMLQSLPMRDRGVKRARFYVIRRTSMPAVLVETGFVTGAEDAQLLANPVFRSQIAQAIAKGILLYIRQNY